MSDSTGGNYNREAKPASENSVEGLTSQAPVSREQAQGHVSDTDVLKEIPKLDSRGYRSVVESLPDVFFSLTLDGEIIYLNPAFQTITGWPCEDWIGKPFKNIISPDNLAYAEKSLARFISGEDLSTVEIVFLNKDGGTTIGEVSAVLNKKEGEIINILGMVHDITARKKAQDDLLKSKNRLELISKIAAEINSSASLDSIINNTIERISEFFGDFRIIYSKIDKNGSFLCVKSSQPETVESLEGLECDLSAAPEYLSALRAKEVIISEDITKDERFREFEELLLDIKVKSLVDVPVFGSEGLAGMVCMDSAINYKWTEYEIETLKEASENLGLAIKKSQMEEDRVKYEKSLHETLENLSKKNRDEEILSTVAIAAHQSIDLGEVMDNAVESLSSKVEGVDVVAIFMVRGNDAELKAHRGLSEQFIKAAGTIPYSKGVIWKTILTQTPVHVRDTDNDSVIGPAGIELGIKSYISIPISFGDNVVGAMNIASLSKYAFGQDEVKLLLIVGKQIEIALNNARQAEAFRESEERYRTLFDQSPMGVYIFDKHYKITNCNKRMEEILHSSYDSIVGTDMSGFRDTRIYSLIKKVIDGNPAVYEGLCEVSSGPDKPFVCVRLTPLRDEEQNVVGGMAVVEDITERKLAEEKLSIQENRIRSLYEISAEPAVGIDEQLMETLKTGATVMGLDIAAISQLSTDDCSVLYSYDPSGTIKPGGKVELGQSLCSISFQTDDVVAIEHAGDSQYKDNPGYKSLKLESFISVPLRVNGELFGSMYFTSTHPRDVPFSNEDKDFIRLVGRWVSTMIERSQTEVMLSDKEELYRTLVENAHDLIIETNIDGTVVYLNSNHKDVLGYNSSDLMCETIFDYIHEDDRSAVISEFMSALLKNDAANAVFRFKHKNGEWRWIESAGKSFRTSNGELRWVVDSRDISERKRTDEQIQKSLREKESLLREIHHRVKNNLQVISSLLSLQSDYAKGVDSSKLFDESQNRISAIALIHEQLYQSEDLAEINIGNYIDSLTGNLLTVYGDEGDNVAVEFNTDDLSVNIDTAIPCGLIINELFSNCLKHAFVHKNGGTKGKHPKDLISVGFKSNNAGSFVLSVKDNGVGIPEGLDYTDTESLGLQLVCTLTEQLGGVIEVENGHGCEFQITFPSSLV